MNQSLEANASRLAKLSLCVCGALLTASLACVKLPRRVSSTGGQTVTLAAPAEFGNVARININTATPAELEKLPGIGRGLAARIVEHRQQFGSFRRAEHLMIVRGISARRFQAMRALITTE